MAEFEPYRSREIVWAKPRTNPRGEHQMYTRDGKVMPREGFDRGWEKIEESKDAH